jgi:hypothetical protein
LVVRAMIAGTLILLLVGGCQAAAPVTPTEVVATIESVPTSAATLEPRFNPTAAVGGGSNASGTVSAEQLATVFGAVQQASQMRFSANASPAGASGAAVTSVSITAQDAGGVLKTLDATARRTLGEALLTAAATAWPQARITLLVSDPTSSNQIVGSRPPGGPSTILAT